MLQDALGGGDAAEAGHPDVHEDHVGPVFGGQRDGLGPVGRLADDGHPRGGAQQGGHPGADEDLVVHDEDAYDGFAVRGSPGLSVIGHPGHFRSSLSRAPAGGEG
ncbi:hypothetical protein GCM10020000_22060 [Streptomyces olivoverticillatus]